MREANGKTTAIILAAGRGRRLRPFTNNTPKCLLDVGGLPILHRQLSALRQNNIRDIVMAVGFMAEAVKKYALRRFPDLRFTFVHNPEFARTNTLYSLALTAERLNEPDTILQLNGDVVFDHKVIQLLLDSDPAKSYVAVKEGKCGEEEIKVVLAEDGRVSMLNKKINPAAAHGEAVGINKFCGSFWAELARSLSNLKSRFRQEYFEYAVEQAITNGGKIFPLAIGGRRATEIDFPEDLGSAKKWFKNKKS